MGLIDSACMKVSVILLAYNEEKRIGKTLYAVESFFSSKPFDHEIIVVDDGSKDNTRGVVKEFQNKNKIKKTH